MTKASRWTDLAQPPVSARGSNATRMRVTRPFSMCCQFAVGRAGGGGVQVEPGQHARAVDEHVLHD
jgi:hypothetical protein